VDRVHKTEVQGNQNTEGAMKKIEKLTVGLNWSEKEVNLGVICGSKMELSM
jgi:hypothetical protein